MIASTDKHYTKNPGSVKRCNITIRFTKRSADDGAELLAQRGEYGLDGLVGVRVGEGLVVGARVSEKATDFLPSGMFAPL